jgi:hypothetical protein
MPLTDELVRDVKLYDGRSLPGAVHNVFREEHCGKDCTQLLRFELPAKDAPRLLDELSGQPAQPVSSEEQMRFFKFETARKWFIQKPVGGSWGVISPMLNGSPLIRYIAQPEGRIVHVYVRNFTM